MVVVDNTNVRRWEMGPYLKLAADHGYAVILTEPRTPWRCDPAELAARNRHGVGEAVVAARAQDWQSTPPRYTAWLLNPDDTAALLERAGRLLSSCGAAVPQFRAEVGGAGYSRAGLGPASRHTAHCTARFLGKHGELRPQEQNSQASSLLCAIYFWGPNCWYVIPSRPNQKTTDN